MRRQDDGRVHFKNSVAGGSACLVATSIFNPLEVIKIQMQSQPKSNGGLLKVGWKLFQQEGFWHGLMRPGLIASGCREVTYSSIRFAIYPQLRSMFKFEQNSLGVAAFMSKFGSGLVAGAIGSSIANPGDLLKIRLQSEPGRLGPDGRFIGGRMAGLKPTYSSTWNAFSRILQQEGWKGLYRGVSATCTRSALLTAGQLSSYDHSKQFFKSTGYFREGFPLHILSSVISGFVAATCCAPADRIKTFMMLGRERQSFGSALIQIWKSEGIKGFYRGWAPSYFRLAPHFIIVPRH